MTGVSSLCAYPLNFKSNALGSSTGAIDMMRRRGLGLVSEFGTAMNGRALRLNNGAAKAFQPEASATQTAEAAVTWVRNATRNTIHWRSLRSEPDG
jgi:hypothetical protein